MATHDHHDRRREYLGGALTRDALDPDPHAQFAHWLHAVLELATKDATAMTLATVGVDGAPAARTVLLKQHGHEGFTWFSDARSQKGQELARDARALLLFYWRDLDRQVRIAGTVHTLPIEEAERYFHDRPEGSRFSAAASVQSAVIGGRDELEARVRELHARYPNGDVPRPAEWIGYRLVPHQFEFWQGRENRLHDRFRYRREGDAWRIERLSP